MDYHRGNTVASRLVAAMATMTPEQRSRTLIVVDSASTYTDFSLDLLTTGALGLDQVPHRRKIRQDLSPKERFSKPRRKRQ